jgi:nitrogenase molybdenum-iron protein alpha chain
MSYFEQKEPPRREQRLYACIACGGNLTDMTSRRMKCTVRDGGQSVRWNLFEFLSSCIRMT